MGTPQKLMPLSRPGSNRMRKFPTMEDTQTKMMQNFLLEQINSVEKNLRGELKKAFFLVSAERERSSRIETNLRLNQEQVGVILESALPLGRKSSSPTTSWIGFPSSRLASPERSRIRLSSSPR